MSNVAVKGVLVVAKASVEMAHGPEPIVLKTLSASEQTIGIGNAMRQNNLNPNPNPSLSPNPNLRQVEVAMVRGPLTIVPLAMT